MKKIFVIALAVVLVLGLSGLALAGNTADVDQTGDNNTATIDQDGRDNDAYQYQEGDSNVAIIDQAPGYWTADNKAEQYQYGDNNWARIEQGYTNNGNHYSATIGPIKQTQIGIDGGVGNRAEIIQNVPSRTYANDAQQYQEGDENEAYIEQTDEKNDAFQYQNGYGNYGSIVQDGMHNGSNCTCGDCEFVDSEGKPIACDSCCEFPTLGYTQYQNGEGNEAYIDVFGDHNNTCQWQRGDLNFADIDIDGDFNTAKQVQLGSGNDAWITQNGDNNTACQYQNGGHSSTITQTGDGNCACVIQES